MSLKKQEFYEGAALYVLARTDRINSIRYEAPFFRLNGERLVLLKYTTKSRSPWGFTFTRDEQAALRRKAAECRMFIGLICGSDGVAAFGYDAFVTIAGFATAPVHVACYRPHRKHYEVAGPKGTLQEKVAPANWKNILDP